MKAKLDESTRLQHLVDCHGVADKATRTLNPSRESGSLVGMDLVQQLACQHQCGKDTDGYSLDGIHL